MSFNPFVRRFVVSRALIVAQFAIAPGAVALAQSSDSATVQESSQEASRPGARSAEPKGTPQTDGTHEDARDVERSLPGLEEMLAVALQHNPDIRAADAQLRVAEAERDRTRLAVVQRIVAYRGRWQKQRAAVTVAEEEFHLAERTVPAGAFEAAQRKVAAERDKLRELRAELPFLLGRPLPQAGANAPANVSRRTELLRDTLRPLLKNVLDASIQEYRVGRGSLERIYDASYRLLDVERSLATTEAERIAAIETHRDLMKEFVQLARAQHRIGQEQQSQILATEVYAAEAELLLLDERGQD